MIYLINAILKLSPMFFFAIMSNAVKTSWTWLIIVTWRIPEWNYRTKSTQLNTHTHTHNFLTSLKCYCTLSSLWRSLTICKSQHFWPHGLSWPSASYRISPASTGSTAPSRFASLWILRKDKGFVHSQCLRPLQFPVLATGIKVEAVAPLQKAAFKN